MKLEYNEINKKELFWALDFLRIIYERCESDDFESEQELYYEVNSVYLDLDEWLRDMRVRFDNRSTLC